MWAVDDSKPHPNVSRGFDKNKKNQHKTCNKYSNLSHIPLLEDIKMGKKVWLTFEDVRP